MSIWRMNLCMNPKRIFTGLVVSGVLGFGLTGCHSTPSLNPQQAEGKHLYEVHCAHCHRDNDLQLKKVPPDLHDLFARTTLPSGAPATDVQVERTILSGRGMMPPFAGRFTQDQLDALVVYLHTNLSGN